jgi:hypothetical protein
MGTVLSLLVLGIVLMLVGAVYLWRSRGERKRPLLMAVLAVVMLANVLIWTLPGAGGQAPIDAELR